MEEQSMHHPPNPPAPVIDSPHEKATVTDPREPITGTADSPAEQVSIQEGANLLGTTPVFGHTWTYTPETDWTEGAHWVSATASYRARFDHHYGDIYSTPTHVAFDVAAIPLRVAAPVIVSPGEGATVTALRQQVTGTADPDVETVTLSEGSTPLLGEARVTGTTWTYTPTTDWAPGPHTLTATAHRGILTSPPSAPRHFSVLSALAAPVIVSPGEGATVTALRQQVTGTADPGVDKVTLADGSTPLPGEAHVTGTSWTYTPTTDWAPGSHAVTATARRSGRDSPASAPRHFSVQTPSPTVSVDLVDPLADQQAEQVDCAFTHKLDVHITENEVAVRMLPITFTINGSTDSVFDTGATAYPSRTDDQGVAPATTLYAGDTPGGFTVTVTSPERADVRKDIRLTVQPRS
ncbi:hypothetical protein [Streptomyces sp. NRRL B-1347]|uniref:hypothetical protein n=1 Tax=Streptomyces sp. NRRL B-1347 TaxID=1476877 RepID=UPI0004C54DAF|nr:hypothetical protein [Streptomyces sp. NRRL B-1347]